MHPISHFFLYLCLASKLTISYSIFIITTKSGLPFIYTEFVDFCSHGRPIFFIKEAELRTYFIFRLSLGFFVNFLQCQIMMSYLRSFKYQYLARVNIIFVDS